VDAILCGGDLFEHDRIGPDTVEFLKRTLSAAPCPVYLAPGNHDWFGPQSPYALVAWPSNVHVFQSDRFQPVELTQGVRLWGAAHRAPANTDDFFSGFTVDGGGVNLALAHAAERGGLLAEISGKQPHAPFDAPEIVRAGIDYAFLGHYHTPRIAEHHLYPGNPDPLEFGESGDRGAVIATFDGTARTPDVVRHRVAVSQVHDTRLDVTGAPDRDVVAERVTSAIAGLGGCVRLSLSGELAPTVELDRTALLALGGHLDGFVVVASGVTYAYDLESIALETTVMGQFVRDATEGIADDELRRRVILTGLRALDGRNDLEVA